ncbi:hypothetical protein B0H10DRAFT_1987086 [Mycena sp. CBHHK59/15]|nr:hypothetical protein B0H10DRAFT_1987086 [Mycena sp. CBHHK59/15]
MIDFIDSYESSNEEDIEEGANKEGHLDAGDAVPAAVDTSAMADADAPTTAKPLKFKFDTREGITSFAKWCLQPHEASGTKAFHWKIWGDSADKKGFLQSYLILHVLAYHLACLEEIPNGYERLKSYPESALLMSVQAVKCELQFWLSGEYMNPNRPANFFSQDNYDDSVEIVQTATTGKKQKKLVRHATKFLSSIQKRDEARWEEVIEAAKEFMEVSSHKRAQTASHSGSEAGDDMVLSDDDDAVMVLSD